MIPDNVRRDLLAEVTIARASAYSTEQWVHIICETIERHTEQYGLIGFKWKVPIVLPEDPMELVTPAPAPAGSRSDVPPSPSNPMAGWWPGEGYVA